MSRHRQIPGDEAGWAICGCFSLNWNMEHEEKLTRGNGGSRRIKMRDVSWNYMLVSIFSVEAKLTLLRRMERICFDERGSLKL